MQNGLNTDNTNKINIIAYGSLMNPDSMSRTIPKRKGVPVLIKGYKRVFNLKASRPYLYKNLKTAECAVLNVVKCENSFFNAIMFRVTDDELRLLKIRERSYYTKEVEVLDIRSEKKISKALLFIGRKIFRGERIVDDSFLPIPEYLETVKKGAFGISRSFGKMFEETTFLGDGRTIKELSRSDPD